MTTPARGPRPATIQLADCERLLREREATHRANVRTREEAHRAEIERAQAAAREEEAERRAADERRQVVRYRLAQVIIGALVVLIGKLLGADIPWPG